MTFIKKIVTGSVLFITLIVINGCSQPPEYFNELKETDLLIYPQEAENFNLNDNTNNQEKVIEEENIDIIN